MSKPALIAEPLFTLTETLPTEEGWYWRKPNPHYLLPFIVQVMLRRPNEDSDQLALCVWNSSHRCHYSVAEMGGLWSERIPEPGEFYQ